MPKEAPLKKLLLMLLFGMMAIGCNSTKPEKNNDEDDENYAPVLEAPDGLQPIVDLFPADTFAVGFARPHAFVNTEFARNLPFPEGMKLDGALAEAKKESGVDFKKLEYVGFVVRFPLDASEEEINGMFLGRRKVDRKFDEGEPKKELPPKPGPKGKPFDNGPADDKKDDPIKDDEKGDCGEAYASSEPVKPPALKLKEPQLVVFLRFTEPMDVEKFAKSIHRSDEYVDYEFKSATVAGKKVVTAQRYWLELQEKRVGDDSKPERIRRKSGNGEQIAQIDKQTILFGPKHFAGDFLKAGAGKNPCAAAFSRGGDADSFAFVSLEGRETMVKVLSELTEKVPPFAIEGLNDAIKALPKSLKSLAIAGSMDERKPMFEVTFEGHDEVATKELKKAADGLKKAADAAVKASSLLLGFATTQMNKQDRELFNKVIKTVRPGVEKMVAEMKVEANGDLVTLAIPNPGLTKMLKELKPTFDKAMAAAEARARTSMLRYQMSNIGRAARSYGFQYESLPVSKQQAELLTDGKPHHSWRVALIENLDYRRELRGKVQLDEAWDSEANKKLHTVVVSAFTDRDAKKDQHLTRVRTFDGPGTPISGGLGDSFDAIDGKGGDGAASTLLFFYAAKEHAVPVMKPGGITFDPKKPEEALKALGPISPAGTPIALCNGNVVVIKADADPKEFAKLVTYNDGQKVDWTKLTDNPPRERRDFKDEEKGGPDSSTAPDDLPSKPTSEKGEGDKKD